MEKTKVVIVGGTGYLGQHLLQAFAGKNGVDRYDVAFTHHSSPLPRHLLDAFPHFPAFPVDLKTGLGFHSISQDFGQPDVVVNCAALSVPRVCEQDPDSGKDREYHRFYDTHCVFLMALDWIYCLNISL